jgi:hypothetical protein
MLTPIPARILRDTVTFFVPKAIDGYQEPENAEYTVQRVHLQSDNSTRRTANNQEVTLRGTLFVDARLSFPALDYWDMQTKAQAAGAVMTCTVKDRRGGVSGPYTVQTIDGIPDDEGNIHHWELGLT